MERSLVVHSRLVFSLGCALAMLLDSPLIGQQAQSSPKPVPADMEEFMLLEPLLQQAITKAAPAVVSVETFGGARRVLAGGGGPIDSQARPGEIPGRKTPPPPPPRDDDEPKPLGPLKTKGFLQTQGKSTGFVISADGWIVTSRFTLNFDPTTIVVTLADGRSFTAERKGEDTSRGIALLKIDATDLPTLPLADPKAVTVGSWAFSLGRTFAVDEPTVHMGIVSAKRRQFGRALQIDCWTSPANYGGPTIDLEGRVLGLTVPLSASGADVGAEWYDSGIGFAATLHDIPDLIERMKTGEVLHRAWLGIALSPVHMGPGALLAMAPRAGAAFDAGLRKGDTIVEVDGVAVKNGFHLQMLIGQHMGGDPVFLKVAPGRGEGEKTMTLFLKDAPYSERKAGGDLPGGLPFELPGQPDLGGEGR